MLGGLNALSTIKSYKAVIEHENGVVEGEFIYGAMSNSLSVAGMVRLNDDLVDLSDGKFEILLVRRPKDVMEVNSILTGVLNKTYDSPCLTIAQSSFVKVTFEAVSYTHLDVYKRQRYARAADRLRHGKH